MRQIWILWLAVAAYAQTGESLYLSQCAMCHGPKGEGGRGSMLTRAKLRHAPDDDALYRVIRRGIPGTGMPGTGFSDREIRLVMEHVRAFGKVTAAPLKGYAQRGEQIYKRACEQCHSAFGPDLNGIGARRSPTHLRTSLTDPEADVPRGFVMVRAVMADRTITGLRVNEDTFSIQIRDLSGRVHSFWKTELRELHIEQGKSAMPAFRSTLNEGELDDVVAYLASLQEAQ